MAIVNLDKIQAKKVGNLEHLVFTQDVTNGVFAHAGELVQGLVSGDGEAVKAVVPTEESIVTDEVILHASPELEYDPRKAGLKHFKLEAGEVGRGYHLTAGDIVTLTADLFEGTPVVNEYVVPQAASMKLAPAAELGNTRFAAKVIEKTVLGFDGAEAYAIKVVKA
ncbi:hypothetical protein PQ478_08500 [Alkalihalophilus pseudofirmus]|uniref:hypothetical protein n=1 Tax=Alkalihalophilus pseudofirmus TaxID=79885 RepID=UPI00259B1993|nr:hypothetical protein [Alkalihalophilus pseudofirmus]WEG18508.1 hypothetical protein PQ478_08500 [Alkalihalophilus pseudofirmus]